ncbi:RNA polymerase sigma factor [Streptomyces sp. NPDC001178]
MIEPAPEPSPAATEAKSFNELFMTGFARIVRSLVFLGANRATAEDLAAEAFVTAYERWQDICHYDSPIDWVAKVAVNKWRQHCRTAKRRTDLALQEAPARIMGANNDLAVADKRIDVRRCVQRLPERQREVIVLHYILDQTVSAIAFTLGVAEGTVKSQLHDARRTLADLMADGYRTQTRKEA